MYKSVTILLTFVAYSLTLVHSVVPHQHDDTGIGHYHQEKNDHHHHEDHDDEKKTISHVFADAIHHPASEVVIHTAASHVVQKQYKTVDILIVKLNELLIPELKPPDLRPVYQENFYSSDQESFFFLRGPPIA